MKRESCNTLIDTVLIIVKPKVHVTLTVKERLGSTFGNVQFETFTDLTPSETFDHANGDRVLYKVSAHVVLFQKNHVLFSHHKIHTHTHAHTHTHTHTQTWG